ncbi:MAG: hypothetical protein K9N46_08235 [Candidatus Marinimicrobia bacterium]|nr:hypothetical protein [Candidatus Neomarinimicrobiota bacterium]MCF7828795.1 hypothetical protein [Candidatus Neomarinimicrobiota bacterium]MCF7880712.1 hypothetical protein [Candidatus Neomarinimicrobiota bacterium]
MPWKYDNRKRLAKKNVTRGIVLVGIAIILLLVLVTNVPQDAGSVFGIFCRVVAGGLLIAAGIGLWQLIRGLGLYIKYLSNRG